MEKNAIKKYAVWARRELIARVAQRAGKYGVTEDGWGERNADSVNGHVLSAAEKKQRMAFVKKVQSEGYEQAIEEAAYTWFNRFCALRYMEVNGYLPSHVRVFTNDAGEFKPQILSEALHLDLDGLDVEKVLELKEDASRTEDLFRYLLITQCNALQSILPGMFQKIEDYTELLLPDNLLREGSVLERLIAEIPEEDWTDQVQIIGWLYQYYNAEKKDEVFAALKKNVKITKENIPAATQLFTPDWIVRYMVENSLGRLWIEGHPNESLQSKWKYYLGEAEQEPEVEAQLAEIRREYAARKPEEIRCIDPCCGSGHILAYMFDVLMQIYESCGYTAREAVRSIVENNLYGLDIDERAAQLAAFAVMMKARSYDRRFFSRGIQPHVYAIRESNEIDPNLAEYFVGDDPKRKKDFGTLMSELHDAKEYGSILHITPVDFEAMAARVEEGKNEISLYSAAVTEQILPLIQTGQALAQRYDVVVTNPPYMGSGNMNPMLGEFVKENYPDSKSDLSTAFMEKTMQMCVHNGYMAMINIPVWMFLSSYEKLRTKLFAENTLTSMVHPGRGIFGSDFGTTTFVFRRGRIGDYRGTYYRLFDKQGEVKSPEEREQALLAGKGHYTAQQCNFSKIPGSPVAYWASENLLSAFNQNLISDYGYPKQGFATGNNEKFLRYWYEVSIDKIGIAYESTYEAKRSQKKWFPCNKGGNYRRWYGNNFYIANWENDGAEMKAFSGSVIRNPDFYFHEGITWSSLSSGKLSMRYSPKGFIFESKGSVCFLKDSKNIWYILGLMNTDVVAQLLLILSPTLDYHEGPISRIPVVMEIEKKEEIDSYVKNNIVLCKSDWDSFEISWEFTHQPLVQSVPMITEAYATWKAECDARFNQLKANEEELNRIFIDIYGLQDELTPEEDDSDVTVRRADLRRDIKSLLSYAVGCMFGRYSLDVEGLAYAGGEWDTTRYKTFLPDTDGIIPICDDEYFTDDIVGRFVEFIRVVYGEDTLEENLQFIADALGGTGSSREVIRKYFLKDFYADHCKVYKKRPIYWLFDSGKKNGFKCLIYLHRYRPDTIARIRTDYVHEQQSRYRTALADLDHRIAGAATSNRIQMNRQRKKLQDQADELHEYEEKIHHLADQFIDIDLDDGVKVNYAKFQDVLAKIR